MPRKPAPVNAAAATRSTPLDPRRFPTEGSAHRAAGAPLEVEVQFVSPLQAVAAQAIFGAAPTGQQPPGADLGFASVLSRYGAQQLAPLYDAEELAADQAHLDRLRAHAALNASASAAVQRLQALPTRESFLRLKFPPDTPQAALMADLRALPGVAAAVVLPGEAPPEPLLPADPLIGAPDASPAGVEGGTHQPQWYLHRLRVPQAWQHARGAGVVIATIDWGCRTSHAELSSGLDLQRNIVDGSDDVAGGPQASHGTAVLGLAGARADGRGICGVAPEARLWTVRADGGPVDGKAWADAIDFVRTADSGGRRKVIVLEVQTAVGGNYEQMPSVRRAVVAAIAAGCVVCVAAGNGDRRADLVDDGQPFDPTGSILVGATAWHPDLNRRAAFSNHGPRVVVAAPGDPVHDVTCDSRDDGAYRNDFGGTSGAAPKVAGVVALMLSANPALTHEEVRDILVGTGRALADDPGKPVGVFVDAEAAVAEAMRRAGAAPSLAPSELPPRRRRQLQGTQRRAVASPALPPGTLPGMGFAPTPAAAATLTDMPLKMFREAVSGTLTQADRILIVEQAILLLENFYVHRLLKESIHAVRPVQRLRVWLRRLQQSTEIPEGERDELAFHNTLTQIFNSVRDLHTGYQLPRPYRDHIAYLPFEVAAFHEDGRTRYLVTRTVKHHAFQAPGFGVGAELVYWNGMTTDRAVVAAGEQTAGGNEAARRARGLAALTIRAMNTMLPPLEDHVDLLFVPAGAAAAAARPMRQDWLVRFAPQRTADGAAQVAVRSAQAAVQAPVVLEGAAPPPVQWQAAAAGSPALALLATQGVDVGTDAVREARQLIFDAEALSRLEDADEGEERVGLGGNESAPALESAAADREVGVKVPWNLALRARILTVDQRPLGCLQIRTFNVDDADGFVQEAVRLLQQMPDSGLVIDVRGNGGGSIWAAERLLQTLTAATIEPERLQFIATPGTRDLCRHNDVNPLVPLSDWRASLDEAVETGSVYSRGFSVTAAESCNTIGQVYYGPVVLLVDGNCYSATDMFAAGFQDHGIGPVLGVAPATGAGGANVWDHGLLSQLLPAGWGLQPLPNGAGLRVAVRQALRVGARSGALLEDFGVVPDRLHRPGRADVLGDDAELMAVAAAMLARRSSRSLAVTRLAEVPGSAGLREVRIDARGLRRLDFYLDGRPQFSHDLAPDAQGRAVIVPRIRAGSLLRLAGFAEAGDAQPAASWRGRV